MQYSLDNDADLSLRLLRDNLRQAILAFLSAFQHRDATRLMLREVLAPASISPFDLDGLIPVVIELAAQLVADPSSTMLDLLSAYVPIRCEQVEEAVRQVALMWAYDIASEYEDAIQHIDDLFADIDPVVFGDRFEGGIHKLGRCRLTQELGVAEVLSRFAAKIDQPEALLLGNLEMVREAILEGREVEDLPENERLAYSIVNDFVQRNVPMLLCYLDPVAHERYWPG